MGDGSSVLLGQHSGHGQQELVEGAVRLGGAVVAPLRGQHRLEAL